MTTTESESSNGFVPDWLARLAIEQAGTPAIEQASPPDVCSTTDTKCKEPTPTPYGLAALNEEVEALRQTPSGAHNNRLNEAAFKCAQLVPSGHLTEEAIRTQLADAALAVGHAESRTERTLTSGIQAGIKNPRNKVPPLTRPNRATNMTDAKSDHEHQWSRPDTFNQQRSLPPFPLDVFGWYAPEAEKMANYYQVPTDLIGMGLLSFLSAAVRGRLEVEIQEGWTEQVNLYTVTVLGSGETKSPVWAQYIKPLKAEQDRLQLDARPVISSVIHQRQIIQDQIKQEKKRLASEGEMMSQDLMELIKQLDECEVPSKPELLSSDTTPEALVERMVDQQGVMAILASEGGMFATMFGRYNRGIPNIDIFLKAHDGREALIVDRKGADRVQVENPCLTIGLAVQPDVLTEFMSNETARRRGLTARFLYAVPPSRVGYRDFSREAYLGRSLGMLPSRLFTLIDQRVPDIRDFEDYEGSRDHARGKIIIRSTTTTASNRFYDWQSQNEVSRREVRTPSSKSPKSLYSVLDWSNKINSNVLVIACLLQLLWSVDPNREDRNQSLDITDEAMAAAIMLMDDYFIAHAKAAHEVSLADGETTGRAREILDYLVAKDIRSIKVSDLFQKLRGREEFNATALVQQAIDDLERRGYVERRPDVRKQGRGRPPSPTYDVNPYAFDETTKD